MSIDWQDAWGPEPLRVGLDVRPPERLPDAAAVRRWLTGCGGSGWLCTLDQVRRFSGELGSDEVPLHADLRLSDSESAQLRFGGGWTLWRYVELDEGDMLAMDETRLTHDGKGVWRVYWAQEPGPDGISVYRPRAARLLRVFGEE